MKTKTTIITIAALATSLTIHAEQPPVLPTGSLVLGVNGEILDKDMGDYFPLLKWSIAKQQGQGKKAEPVTDKNVDPVEVVAADSDPDSEDAANNGLAKSNNGHGNNKDGIDVSNPGKSAEVWFNKGMFDTDVNGDDITDPTKVDDAPDDEASGGGAAPSQ